MIAVRSALFWVVFFFSTIIFSATMVALFWLPFNPRYKIGISWAKLNIFWLELTCNLHYKITGLENIKGMDGGIVFSKHQSSWETLALQFWFNPPAWVLKRELLRIPFFGWGMALSQPIAINRNAGRKAVEQMIEQGRERLKNNRWVIIFPEGTRIAAGKRGRYRIGGAILAERTQAPVIPVAHNAGEYWPRQGFLKYPGTIQIHVGPAISSHSKKAQQIMDEAEQWIETEMASITTLTDHEHGAVKNVSN